jgi:hypothetical protein
MPGGNFSSDLRVDTACVRDHADGSHGVEAHELLVGEQDEARLVAMHAVPCIDGDIIPHRTLVDSSPRRSPEVRNRLLSFLA